jgi:hypothetical protein
MSTCVEPVSDFRNLAYVVDHASIARSVGIMSTPARDSA